MQPVAKRDKLRATLERDVVGEGEKKGDRDRDRDRKRERERDFNGWLAGWHRRRESRGESLILIYLALC